VRLHDWLRCVGTVLEGPLSRPAARWLGSVSVESPDPPRRVRENHTGGGGDGGLSAWATRSTGEKIMGPTAYAAAWKKLRQ
jgi:putative transposase